MQTGYPTDVDLKTLIKDLDITVPSAARLKLYAVQAAKAFEKQTGWTPFLATTQTRKFDPPGSAGGNYASPRGGSRMLALDAGLLSVSSLTVTGQPLIEGKDYWVKPNNTTPKQWVEFARPIGGHPQCIEIVGSWGYATTVPADAFTAMLRLAALEVLSDYIVKVTGGVVKWSEGAASEEFGEQPLLGIFSEWTSYTDSVIDSYKRVTVYA